MVIKSMNRVGAISSIERQNIMLRERYPDPRDFIQGQTRIHIEDLGTDL